MFKSSVVLALMGSTAAATLRPNPSASDVRKHVQKSLSMKLQTSHSNGVASTQSQIESSAAVSGAWFMEHIHNSASCSNTAIAGYGGYEMSVCVEDYDTSSSSSYSIYTCTQDSSTGDVVLQRTTYTDAACTTGSSVKTPVSYSNTCTSGKSYFCDDMNDVDTTESMTSDGLYLEGFTSSSDCNAMNSSALIAYSGSIGCGEDGLSYGKDTLDVYLTSDCTGAPIVSFGYSEFFSNECVAMYDDDDAAVDDDGELIYDGLFVYGKYGGSGDDDVCFHVDSKINYKGVEYTYEELKAGKEPECTVPHSPYSKGVIITTSCDKTVRVTDTHLLSTTKGFQLAYSLKAGDVLFGDYDSELCTVKSVEKEKSTQKYFGLNCVHSEVLASGLRASTFGDFHTLPSWYMTYVGSVLGTETASTLGDYIAEWYYQK